MDNDFLGWLVNRQNLDDLVDEAFDEIEDGEEDFTLHSDWDLSNDDLTYIEREIRKRL